MSSITHPTDGVLHTLLDEEVSGLRRHELERHLTSCDACAERFAKLQESQRVAGTLLDILAPESPGPEADHLLQRARRSRVARRWLLVAAIAALLASMALVTCVVLRSPHRAAPHKPLSG